MAPDDVLKFWLDEVDRKDWYVASDALDATITRRFAGLWQQAMDGALSLWLTHPNGALAYIVLTDQFPRNMFRGTGQAFASDVLALAAAKAAIAQGWDLRVDEPARHFFYMPLMHSENLVDQERCVRLVMTRLPKSDPSGLRHARAHREVIRRFGRFPYRNDALARITQKSEAEYLAAGGYGATVDAIPA